MLPPASTPDVVVNAKRATPSKDSTATESVLESHEIEDGGSLGDLLQLAPGVQIRSNGGLGARQSVLMRGTDSQQSLVLLDGVRLNSAFGGGVDLSLLSLDGVDRIEVYRGGGAALHGSDALGGVIRIVPRLPQPGLIFRYNEQFGFFGTSIKSTTIGWGKNDGNAGGVITGTWASSRNDFPFVDVNGQSRIREHAASDRQSMLAIGGYKPRNSSQIRVMGEFTSAHNELPGVEQFPSNTATNDRVRGIASLTYEEADLGVSGLALSTRASVRLQQSHVVDSEPQLPPPADTLTSTLGLESDVALTWDVMGGHRLRLKGGATLDMGEVERLDSPSKNPSRTVGSILAADEWMLMDGEITIQGALRVDSTEQYGATLVPRLGVAWDVPLDSPWRLTVKSGVGRSWRYPSFDELYFDTGLVRGNEALSPEDAWSVDGSVQLRSDWMSLELAAYHLRINNLILFLPTTAFTVVATDAQGARNTGIESRLTLRPFYNLYLDMRYSFVDARFRDTERQLPGRARHIYGARIRFEHNGLTLWCAMEGQSAFFMDRFEGIEEEARIFIDLGATAGIGPHLKVGITVKNLTDVLDAVDAMQQPLPGFSLLGIVRVQL
jgi:outer membrane cobalamin receptor